MQLSTPSQQSERPAPQVAFASTDEVNSQAVGGLSDLVSRYNAKCITHWRADPSDEPDTPAEDDPREPQASGPKTKGLTPSFHTERMSELLANAAHDLAQECLRKGQFTYQLFQSEEPILLVAAPAHGINDYALTVVFPLNTKPPSEEQVNTQTRIHLRCQDAALAASRVGIAHLRVQADTAANANFPSELTWPQINQELRKRVFSSVAEWCKSIRSIVLTLAVVILLGFIPWPFTVSAKAICEPAIRRFVATPFDSKLLKCKVVPGEKVIEGQLLAVLDGSDLRSRVAALQAQYSQSQQRRSAAMKSGNASEAELERLESVRLHEEIEILKQQQMNLEIRSPINGFVVSGDMIRVEGSPLSIGDNLFEIAPLADLVVEIAVPEQEIGYVEEGMECRITLEAARGESRKTEITSIHPRSEIRENQSVFIAEAKLENSDDDIRPGMTGQARVSIGWRPIGWVLLHRPVESLRRFVGW